MCAAAQGVVGLDGALVAVLQVEHRRLGADGRLEAVEGSRQRIDAHPALRPLIVAQLPETAPVAEDGDDVVLGRHGLRAPFEELRQLLAAGAVVARCHGRAGAGAGEDDALHVGELRRVDLRGDDGAGIGGAALQLVEHRLGEA